MTDTFHLIWLTGASCDGCTIAVIGDASVVGIESLLAGRVEGLPRVALVHTLLSEAHGEEFVEQLRRAARGDLEPYGLVVETSIPARAPAGSFGWISTENDAPVDIATWLERLAPRAQFVIALGDCAVYGGPHTTDESNPTGATGVESHLGVGYRGRAGLPIVHLPGCATPPVFIATLASILRQMRGDAPPIELDELGRPAAIAAYAADRDVL